MSNDRKYFFSSDHHFFHKKVIGYTNRPFSCVEEMNEKMIESHNRVVTPKDIVYFVGDFAFSNKEDDIVSILKRMNGEKHFVMGNHDKVMRKEKIKKQFASFCESVHKEIYVPDEKVNGGKQFITLCHYAMKVWNRSHHGAFHLYGHSHGSMPDDPHSRSFDVGVDCWNFEPVSYEKVREIMLLKDWKPIDNHE